MRHSRLLPLLPRLALGLWLGACSTASDAQPDLSDDSDPSTADGTGDDGDGAVDVAPSPDKDGEGGADGSGDGAGGDGSAGTDGSADGSPGGDGSADGSPGGDGAPGGDGSGDGAVGNDAGTPPGGDGADGTPGDGSSDPSDDAGTPPPGFATLRVSVTGEGQPVGAGKVTSTPAGIDCPTVRDEVVTCTMQVQLGSDVQLVATPRSPGNSNRNALGAWGGACSDTEGTTCALTVSGDTEVSATFVRTRD